MTRWRRPTVLLGLASLFFASSGCRGCGQTDHVAELIAQKNSVVRDDSGRVGQWRRANRGDLFRFGDGLKTGKAAFARLHLVPDGEMLVQSDTLVRFQNTAPGEKAKGIKVETGSVQIDSARAALQISTEVGLARIERGSRLQLKASPKSSELRVLVGSVELDQQGKRTPVSAGHTLSVDVGGVIIDKEATKVAPVTKPAEVAPAPDAAAAQQAAAEPETPVGPSEASGVRADLSILAGESATIHDPEPPTRVRVPLTGCESGGMVEAGRPGGGYRYAAIRGSKSAVLRLPAGRYLYRIRCTKSATERGRVTAKGSLVIARDAGVRQLPKKPADVTIDADGRNYTVRYQNLLPKITFNWPEAPSSKVYTINLSSANGRTQTQQFSKPRYTFDSGKLAEGTHQFYFAIPGGRRSATGKLSIGFDNSARTASLSEPQDKTSPAGQKVTVSGTALARSKVRIGGAEVATDAQGRFKTEVAAAPDDDAIAVRVQHDATKIHYYLRHLAVGKK
jgi:hypothetical protein